MKKRIFMLAVLILSGLQFAVAAIDEQLRALITASDDIEVTEVTNDEANPWKVENGMASTTHGKTTTNVTATITIKFKAKGYISFQYSDTFDPWTDDDYKIVKLDDVTYANNYEKHTTPTTFTHYISLEEGEHVLTFSHWHKNPTTGNYSQVLSIGNIRLETIESMYKTIHLSAPGTLGVEALSHVNTLPEMRALRLSGKMNASDWNDISKMTGLVAIDMTNVDVETIPANAFTKTVIRFIDFPKTLKTIGSSAFYDKLLTGPLVLPEGLDSIASEAFYRNYITDVTIPASVRVINSSAFRGNASLVSVTLGSGLTSISSTCFYECSNLAIVKGGENVKTIANNAFKNCKLLTSAADLAPVSVGDYAFQSCEKLESFNFSNIKTYGREAFEYCYALKEADLSTATSLGIECFYNCYNLKKVKLGDNITTIPGGSFSQCHALEEVILGSSINSLGNNCFGNNQANALKRVYITAPAPPAVGSTSFYSPTSVTLYVPEYAMVSYKLDNYWSKFTKVEPNPNTPDKVNLYKKLELTSNARIPNSPDIFIGKGGALIVNGNNPQAFGKYLQYLSIGDPELSSSLISRCEAITSAASQFNFGIGSTSGYGYWYYICMPYDVKRSDIILPEGTSIAVRYYDSESRATNGATGNWKDVAADGILRKGQGYIFRTNNTADVGFPATEETHNDIFCSEAVTTPLVQYPAVESANAGWNLVGNPYPCFYDIYYMDFAAPITTWDVGNRTYKAYSATDDNFVLTPLQAFFVQKPELVDAITFQPAGRQINKTIDHSALAMRRAASSKQVQRKLVDVALTCADRTDRTRVVVNANASDDFCADNDAVKMMAYEGTPQIYTIAGADQLAVNEGAHRDGSVALGMYLPADDAYTIAVDRDELGAKLLDYGVEVEMPYTFSAAEGCLDDRFTLTFEAPTTGINTVATDADADNAIYTIDGRRVNSTAQKGIYIQNHKKIVK